MFGSVIRARQPPPTNQSCPYSFDKTDLHVLSAFESQGPHMALYHVQLCLYPLTQVPRGPWVNERGRSAVPVGLPACLSVRPSFIFDTRAICLANVTHGLQRQLSATSCLTGRRGALTNIQKYIQYPHGGTCDTWRAIRPHVAPGAYLKH